MLGVAKAVHKSDSGRYFSVLTAVRVPWLCYSSMSGWHLYLSIHIFPSCHPAFHEHESWIRMEEGCAEAVSLTWATGGLPCLPPRYLFDWWVGYFAFWNLFSECHLKVSFYFVFQPDSSVAVIVCLWLDLWAAVEVWEREVGVKCDAFVQRACLFSTETNTNKWSNSVQWLKWCCSCAQCVV